MDPRITYFPVGNGDCSLITLSDNTQIIIDCNTTEEASDENDPSRYDVHQHLLDFGKKLNGKIPHVDVFILTHADQDHCRGFNNMFYTGDPAKYTVKHSKEDLILIDELWFTHRIFATHEGEPSKWAKAFRKEAQRRIDLHLANSPARNNAGNRIRVVGHSNNPAYKGLGDLVVTPGNYIDVIDQKAEEGLPVLRPCAVPQGGRLEAGRAQRHQRGAAGLLRRRRDEARRARDVRRRRRCGHLVEDPRTQRRRHAAVRPLPRAAPLLVDVLQRASVQGEQGRRRRIPSRSWARRSTARASSRRASRSSRTTTIPPHHAAKVEYVKAVGKDNFISLSEVGNPKRPLPTTFEMSESGPVLLDPKDVGYVDDAVKKVASTPQTYG